MRNLEVSPVTDLCCPNTGRYHGCLSHLLGTDERFCRLCGVGFQKFHK